MRSLTAVAILFFIVCIHALPVGLEKRAFDPCQFWGAFKGLLSFGQKAAPDELVQWYKSLQQPEQEEMYKRTSGTSDAAFQQVKRTMNPATLKNTIDSFMLKTIAERKPLIDQVSQYGFDKVALATLDRADYPGISQDLSHLIKTMPANNGKRVNFWGANPAWTDQHMQKVVTAYNAAQEMLANMAQFIQQKPGSKEFTDFFGTGAGAQTAVTDRIQAMQDMQQLNVYLVNSGANGEVAHAVFTGASNGGLGASINLMGINVEKMGGANFFALPDFPQKVRIGDGFGDLQSRARASTSSGGFVIHEVSHMFGTQDVTGLFLNENGLAGTCYGRQRCLDLGQGNVQNPSNAPYNNADSYQFFAHEAYLYEDVGRQERAIEVQIEQKYHITPDSPPDSPKPLINKNDPLIESLRELMKYNPEGVQQIMKDLNLKTLD